MRKRTTAVSGLALAFALTAGGASAAFAVDTSQGPCGDVGCPAPGVPNDPGSGPGTVVTSSAPAANPGGGLAFTGADIAGTTVFALGALAAGSALVYSNRRSKHRVSVDA